MNKAGKIISFVLAALFTLYLGSFAAQTVWSALHHRYTMPETGYYYGSVWADFSDDNENLYSLRFEGRSKAHWYSQQPTNFVYTRLDVQLHSFDYKADSNELQATIELPSLQFRCGNTNAILSPELLASLLLKKSGRTTNSMQQMESIMNYIRAAGEGKLPGPNHHGYYFQEPLRTNIKHFQLGWGFGWTVYEWLKIWAILVVGAGWWVFRKRTAATKI